ncbi:MAG: cobalt ECF transporter T component CbiQ [Microcoleaceae cyanobacterium]
MKIALDEYANLNSPIHRWDVKSKLIGLLAVIFAYAWVEDLRLIPAMLITTMMLYFLSKLPLSFLLHRLTYPGLFLLGIVALLPLTSGETILFQWGPLSLYQEGCLAVILIVSRFLAMFITALVLFGTQPFLTTIKAMRSLGLSPILADMILLSYRYLFEVGHQLKTMQKATRLRGFQPKKITRRNLQVYAALAGSLLVRSYQQAEEVYKAMQLRGYGTSVQQKERFSLDSYSMIALTLSLSIAFSFIGLELFV